MTQVIVLSGWSLLLLACLTIIGTAVYLALTGKPVPPEVGDMAKLALGFLFGVLPLMVKEYLVAQQKVENKEAKETKL